MNYIIKNTSIVTQDNRRKIIDFGYIVVEDGIITDVGPRIPKRTNGKTHKLIDSSRFIVIPGLINAHVHLGESIYQGIVQHPKSILDYIEKTEQIVRQNPWIEKNRDVIADFTALMMLKSGTTTIVGGRTVDSGDRLGIRNVSGYMLMNSNKLKKYYKNFSAKINNEFKKVRKSNLSSPAIFIHSIRFVDPATLKKAAEIVRQHPKMPIMIHVAETLADEQFVKRHYGKSSVELLENYSLLTNRTLMVHCNWVDRKDLQIIKKRSSSIVNCLSSNLMIDDGTLKLSDALKEGCRVCLGTDGLVTGGGLELLSEAKSGHWFHNRFCNAEINPEIFFDFVTVNASQAIGMDDSIGSIEKGKYADLVFIDANHPAINRYSIIRGLVVYADPAMIYGVMVGGAMRIWNRHFLAHRGLREKEILSKFIALKEKLR